MKLVDLAQFANQTETQLVTFAPERCLHKRHKEASCDLCFGNCPTQAITGGENVSFDARLCISCGLCLHICPVDAFAGTEDRVGKIEQSLNSQNAPRIELACPLKDSMAVTRANVDAIAEVNPCLAMMSLHSLLEIGSQLDNKSVKDDEAVLWLNDEPCGECPIGSVQSEISRTAETANRILAAYGEKVKVLTYRGARDKLGKPRKKRLLEIRQLQHYSRRDFFRFLAKPSLGKPDDADVLPDQWDSPDNALHQIPDSRKSLLKVLKKLGEPVTSQLDMSGHSFGSVVIADECVACGLCARFCPSEALVFDKDEENFRINFVTAGCLGCNICTLACPTNAVKLNRIVETQKLISSTADLLLTGKLARCERCGMDCAANQDELLCFVCQWRNMLPESDVYG